MGFKPNWSAALGNLGQYMSAYGMQQQRAQQQQDYLTAQGEMYAGLQEQRAADARDLYAQKLSDAAAVPQDPTFMFDADGTQIPLGPVDFARETRLGREDPVPPQDPTFMFDVGGTQVPLGAGEFARESRLRDAGTDQAGENLYEYMLSDGRSVDLTANQIAGFDIKKQAATAKAGEAKPPDVYSTYEANALAANMGQGAGMAGMPLRGGGYAPGTHLTTPDAVKRYGPIGGQAKNTIQSWMEGVEKNTDQYTQEALIEGAWNDLMDNKRQMDVLYDKIGMDFISGDANLVDDEIVSGDKSKSLKGIAKNLKKALDKGMLFPGQIVQLKKDFGIDTPGDEKAFEDALFNEGAHGVIKLLGMMLIDKPKKWEAEEAVPTDNTLGLEFK